MLSIAHPRLAATEHVGITSSSRAATSSSPRQDPPPTVVPSDIYNGEPGVSPSQPPGKTLTPSPVRREILDLCEAIVNVRREQVLEKLKELENAITTFTQALKAPAIAPEKWKAQVCLRHGHALVKLLQIARDSGTRVEPLDRAIRSVAQSASSGHFAVISPHLLQARALLPGAPAKQLIDVQRYLGWAFNPLGLKESNETVGRQALLGVVCARLLNASSSIECSPGQTGSPYAKAANKVVETLIGKVGELRSKDQIRDHLTALLDAVKSEAPPFLSGRNVLLDAVNGAIAVCDRTQLAGAGRDLRFPPPFRGLDAMQATASGPHMRQRFG